jgi:RimJ/RimL family protein N-acetyltransferase
MRPELIPFQIEHVDRITERSVFNAKDQLRERLKVLSTQRGAHMGTIARGEKILAIVGVIQTRQGFGEVWSVTSDEIRSTPIAFHKLALALLRHFEQRLSLTRVQVTVREDYVTGQKWAESLGFVREGVMRKYDLDGSNHVLYARVSDG